jgi:hypothetical protein
MTRSKSKRLQSRILTDALPYAHSHGVGHNRHHNDNNYEAKCLNPGDDRLTHRDEAKLKGLLRFGPRFRERVREGLVDLPRDLRCPASLSDPDHEGPDLIGLLRPILS